MILPAIEEVDGLDAPSLAAIALQLAAIQARVAARLLTLNQGGANEPAGGAVLTPEQAAKRLQVPVTWVYEHRAELGGSKAGKYVRFTEGGIALALRRMQSGRR